MKVRALLSMATVATIGAVAGAGAGASSPPTQYFTAVQTSARGTQTVVAAGPISAKGTDTPLTNRLDTFTFPRGTLTVKHERSSGNQTFDNRTCVFTFSEKGQYVVTRGTGAYVHAIGSGSYRAFAVGQGCDRNRPPKSFALTIEAHGPLSLG